VITTTIKIHFNSKHRKEVLQTVDILSEQDLKSEGCLKAEICKGVSDKDTLYFVEEWATEKDLEKHKKSKSMAVLLGFQYLLVEAVQIVKSVNMDVVYD
jgi:quinol monooxygenase YgiN